MNTGFYVGHLWHLAQLLSKEGGGIVNTKIHVALFSF